MAVAVAVNNVFCAMSFLYLFCYLADETSMSCQQISSVAYELKWYNYSLDLRSFVQLIIMRAQKPCYFHGLNIISITVASFAKVKRNKCTSQFFSSIHFLPVDDEHDYFLFHNDETVVMNKTRSIDS